MKSVQSFLRANRILLLTTFASVLYLILRGDYAAFYSELGTTPEEVGFQQADFLAQTGVALFEGLAGVLIFGAAGAVMAESFHQISRRSRRLSRFFSQPVALAPTVTMGELAVDFLKAQRDRRSFTMPINAVRPGELLYELASWDEEIQHLFAGRLLRRYLILFLPRVRVFSMFLIAIPLGCLWAVLILSNLFLAAQYDAERVEHGYRIEATVIDRSKLWQARLWHAEPVEVVTTSQLGLPPTSCLMYLGQANQVSVFYDAGNKRTVRIPTTQVLITTKSNGADCHSKP